MHLKSLTSLRFFAALFVVFSHFGFLAESSSATAQWFFFAAFSEGHIGVTFFFILSGFILAHSYQTKIRTGLVNYRDFVIARIARIYPLHLLTLILVIPLAILRLTAPEKTLGHFLSALALNLFLVQAWVPWRDLYYSLNEPSWSLSVEMFFYFLFPFVILLRTSQMMFFTGMLIILKFGIGTNLTSELSHFLDYIFPLFRLADFFMGILLYRWYLVLNRRSSLRASSLQLLSIVILVLFFGFRRHVPESLRYDLYYLFPMGSVILTFAWQHGWLARLISGRVLIFLGEISFAVYLIHQPVIRYGEGFRSKWFPHLGSGQELSVAIVYLFIILSSGAALFLLYEKRAKLLTSRFLNCCWKTR